MKNNVSACCLIAAVFGLVVSGGVYAKPDKGTDSGQDGVYRAEENNSNRQSRSQESYRGRGRAEERYEMREPRERGSESSEINSNRQTGAEESYRGRERAEERQDLKESRGQGSESSSLNTNRQTQTEESVRGGDRASERHGLKSTKTAKSHKKTRTKKTGSGRKK
jgi:hypothetical protein